MGGCQICGRLLAGRKEEEDSCMGGFPIERRSASGKCNTVQLATSWLASIEPDVKEGLHSFRHFQLSGRRRRVKNEGRAIPPCLGRLRAFRRFVVLSLGSQERCVIYFLFEGKRFPFPDDLLFCKKNMN
jgi:hypothetical protein